MDSVEEMTSRDTISGIPMTHPLGGWGATDALSLYNGPITFDTIGGRKPGNGSLILKLSSQPHLALEYITDATDLDELDNAKFSVPGSNAAGGFFNSTFRFGDPVMKGTGLIQDPIILGTGESFGRVRFLVLNLCTHGIDQLHYRKGASIQSWRGRMSFTMGPWEVTLDSTPELDELTRAAKVTGSHVITHAGNLELVNRKLFKSEPAARIFETLYWFLSFLNGARCDCILPVGLRHTDTRHWQQWGSRILTPVHRAKSWYTDASRDCVREAAECFHQVWQHENRREWLPLALALYLEANRNTSGVDLALAQSQMALELVSWVALVEEGQALTAAGFNQLSAADKIRLLLFYCQVPPAIPRKLDTLWLTVQKRSDKHKPDGPAVITEIRNSLVHPRRENRAKLKTFCNRSKYDAWQLSMWYVEVGLLKLIGYAGPYSNRLGRERPNTVFDLLPWSPHRS